MASKLHQTHQGTKSKNERSPGKSSSSLDKRDLSRVQQQDGAIVLNLPSMLQQRAVTRIVSLSRDCLHLWAHCDVLRDESLHIWPGICRSDTSNTHSSSEKTTSSFLPKDSLNSNAGFLFTCFITSSPSGWRCGAKMVTTETKRGSSHLPG